jgi:type I restriction enzyme R subunit
LKALQEIDVDNPEALEKFKEAYFVTDESIALMHDIKLLPERTIQDYRSTYNDIRDWIRERKAEKKQKNPK